MPQSKLKLVNTNQVWDAKRRYKINETCTYNNVTYQNATGSNSEPRVGNDWIATQAIPTGVFDYTTTTSILPAGSPETVIKTMLIPANTFKNLDWLTLNVCMYQNEFLAAPFNIYINSSTSLTGATKLMNLTFDGNSNKNGYYAVNDNIFLKNNKIIGFYQAATSYTAQSINPVYYNSAIDLTVNNYIIITYDNSVYPIFSDQDCNVNIESVILQKTN